MPLTQDDIRKHYEAEWKTKSDAASEGSHLSYSSPVEDAVLYPIYERLVSDLSIKANGGRVLDVGSGSGRWIRFFLERFKPAQLVGIDYTQASVDLLNKWCDESSSTGSVRFLKADITDSILHAHTITSGEGFDLINIANVLFHVPEHDKFTNALRNLQRLLAPQGCIITTEYLPRTTFRTNWMLVRSRYEFEAAINAAGLKIADVRATTIFANDPMGLDGPDQAVRNHFHQVRSAMQSVMNSPMDVKSRDFFAKFFADVERAILAYCGERIAQVDFPSQKLVALRNA